MSDQNLQQQQQQYMQQYQQYGYSQSQLYPYNPYSAWDPLQRMEGPSFTGEASVFQRRYGRGDGGESPTRMRYSDAYGDSKRRSRSRSRSRGRDDELANDPAAQKRLKETIKRLRQLEEQHFMQDQLLKDMKMHIGDSGRGSSRSTEDYYDRTYGYSSRSSTSMLPPYSSSSSSRGAGGTSSSSSYESGVMCYKCNKKGHFAKFCPVTDKLCYVCSKPGHISKECPSGASRPDPDKSCYTCGKKGHIAADCPQNADKSCYTCGKRGHIAADCTLGTEKHCYTCGKKGHIAADCMTDRCFHCEKPGHRAVNCPTSDRRPSSSDRRRTSSYSSHSSQSSHHESKSSKLGDQKCLRCSGYGHKIRMCPSTGSTDEKRKCHYCQGVGHLARNCISPGVITKPDESAKVTKVDSETKFMAEEIVKFAKTTYPVREGSKTRAEIDEALKGMGARHRIMEKELPSSVNKNDTTISNQCIFLTKLRWRDMIYDRLVDNLYCYICQRSFPSTKYYQEHVTSKEHYNFQLTLQNAKPGWAVRTKLLKKLCALPSIYVDDGNDEDVDMDDEKTSSGEGKLHAIKPDLYSTDASGTKYFMCRVCHTWGETPLQDHFDSDKHKFLFENQWKCDDCNAYFRGYSDFTQHVDSMLHKQVLVKTGKSAEENDTSGTKKRSLDSSSDEHSGAKKKRFSDEKDADELGLQFLLPVTGFYCKLCQKFYNEAKVSETDHCKAPLHKSKLELWRVENEVEMLKKGAAESDGANGKAEDSQETEKGQEGEDESKNGEGSSKIEVMEQGQETEDVDIEGGDAAAAATNDGCTVIDEWKTEVEGEIEETDANNENPQEESANDAQQGSGPLEAEVSSDEDDDDETIRATRRGRVTRSVKSPKGGKKQAKKLK